MVVLSVMVVLSEFKFTPVLVRLVADCNEASFSLTTTVLYIPIPSFFSICV